MHSKGSKSFARHDRVAPSAAFAFAFAAGSTARATGVFNPTGEPPGTADGYLGFADWAFGALPLFLTNVPNRGAVRSDCRGYKGH